MVGRRKRGGRWWQCTRLRTDAATLLVAQNSALLLGSCCTNMFTVEELVRAAPECGVLLTVVQVLFVVFAMFRPRLLFRERRAPLRVYLQQLLVFFPMATLVNWVFVFRVSVPVHSVLRSTNVIASLLLRYVLLGQRYNRKQVIGVLLASFGIAVVTLVSAPSRGASAAPMHASATVDDTPASAASVVSRSLAAWFPAVDSDFVIGVALLVLVLMLSGLLGVMQEHAFRTYGSTPAEGAFMLHAVSLPFFLFLWPAIGASLPTINASPPVYGVPRLWWLLLVNGVTQVLCVSSVFRLTATTSSLTANLVMGIRKLVSVLLSVLVYQHPFGSVHYGGVGLVALGTALYSAGSGSAPAPATAAAHPSSLLTPARRGSK